MSFIDPTEEELAAVQQLKDRLHDVDEQAALKSLSEMTFLRFLRGRKHSLDDAEKSLRAHLAWRVDNDVENSDSFKCEKEITSKKSFIFGKDKKQHPIVYVFARRHDKNDRDIEEIKRFIIQSINKALKETVPTEEQIIIVFDLTNFGLSCMDYEAVKVLISILAYNYPDILSMVHIVNHPWMFNACWAIIRPWIDPVTASKVNFTNISDLTDFIESENIPVDLGNCED